MLSDHKQVVRMKLDGDVGWGEIVLASPLPTLPARLQLSQVKLFSSPDRTTRVKLLEKIDEFAPHLTTAVVNDKIYT